MSHCTPGTTLKRFEFTPKTVTYNVFVAQAYWEAVATCKHVRGPVAAKLLSPKVLCVCGTAQDLCSVDKKFQDYSSMQRSWRYRKNNGEADLDH